MAHEAAFPNTLSIISFNSSLAILDLASKYLVKEFSEVLDVSNQI